jgi:hypothetical protein
MSGAMVMAFALLLMTTGLILAVDSLRQHVRRLGRDSMLLFPVSKKAKADLFDYGHRLGVAVVDSEGNRTGLVLPVETARAIRDELIRALGAEVKQ